MKVKDSSFQLLPALRLEDTCGHATQRGVENVHSRAGVSLDHLRQGHYLVHHVNTMGHSQRMSYIALEIQKHTKNTMITSKCFTPEGTQFDTCST